MFIFLVNKYFIVCILLSFFLNGASAQIKQASLPLIRNYEMMEYQGGRQTWDIAQKENDLIYFANNDGILEFDGSGWKTYSIPNGSVVRSISVGESNRVYIGAYNDFGYLKTLDNGKKQYQSLREKVPESYRDFGEIWKIITHNNGVIFQSFSTIFFYDGNEVKILDHGKNFNFAFYIRNELYISEKTQGLMRYNGSRFQTVPHGDFFKGKKRIWSMTPLESESILIGTQNQGLFVYNKAGINQWKSEANQFLKNNQLYSFTRISKNLFAFGTIQNGVILVNRKGKIFQHLNQKKGLQNNTVLSVFSDKENNLWLGLDKGIDYLEVNSPITYLSEGLNLDGTGYASAIFEGKLYLGTNQGLFYTDLEKKGSNLRLTRNFSLIEQTKGQVWNLSIIEGRLFCGHDKGAFVINDNESRQISTIRGGWNFLTIPGDRKFILQGAYNGLARYKKMNGRWIFDQKIKGFNESSQIETWDNNGNLWISHGYNGIYRIKLNQNLDSVIDVRCYDGDDGLPSEVGNVVFKRKGNIYASTEKGIYKYVLLPDQFNKDSLLNEKVDGQEVNSIYQDKYQNLWYFTNSSKQIGLIRKNEKFPSDYSINALSKLNNRFVPGFENVHVIDSNNILIGTVDGFALFDPNFTTKDSARFNTIIREISILGNKDTIQYFDISSFSGNRGKIDLPYFRSIRINFTTPFYEGITQNQYSYKLDGYDETWSGWSSRTTKEYTNLPPGNYTFKVKAKNVYGSESNITSFSFKVLPPWYQTIWAYSLYALLAFGFIYLAAHYLSKKVEKEKNEMKKKQQETLKKQQEQHELEKLEKENKIIQLRNEKLQSDLAKKRADAELKSKELSSQAVNINRKNEILNAVKKELEKVKNNVDPETQLQLKQLNKKIDEDLDLDEDWKNFQHYLNEIQGDFIKQIKEKYPHLSPGDLKLCTYLRLNLSSKEIAPLLSITPRGVEIHRYRLRKKLGLDRDQNLVDFLMEF